MGQVCLRTRERGCNKLTWSKDDVAIELSVRQTTLASKPTVEVSELVVLHADQITVSLLHSRRHQGLRFLSLGAESVDCLPQLGDVDILRSIPDGVLEILVIDVHFVGEVDRFQRQALVCGKVIREERQILSHSFMDKEAWVAESRHPMPAIVVGVVAVIESQMSAHMFNSSGYGVNRIRLDLLVDRVCRSGIRTHVNRCYASMQEGGIV